MKVKTRTLVMLGILYCLACQCKWLIILGLNGAIWLHAERMIYVVLFLYCRFGKKVYPVMQPYYKKIDRGISIIFVIGLLEYIYTVAYVGTDSRIAIENSVYAYIKLLAVYPLLYLFVFGGYQKVEKAIVLICGSSMLYQAAVALLYNTRGVVMSNSLIANDEWIRNGNIRLGSTCLIWVLFVLWFCKMVNESNILKKSKDIFLSAFAIVFMILVNQSRSLYVAAIGAVMLVYLFHERRSKGKIVAVLALFAFLVAFTQSPIFNSFMESFSKGGADDTLTGRLELLGLIQQTSRNAIFGFGFIGSTVQLFRHMFYFIDYGIIGDWLQLGIFAGTLYLVTCIILLQNAVKLSKQRGFGFDFTVGVLGFLFIGAIGFTVLSTARNFAIPIILAISQYSTIGSIEE